MTRTKRKEKGAVERHRVVTVPLRLPRESNAAQLKRQALRLLFTLTGVAFVRLGQVKEGLAIETDPETGTITGATLTFRADSEDDAKRARKLIDPKRNEDKPEKKPSASWQALPAELKLNSYGLLEVREEAGKLPLLIFCLIHSYEYPTESGELKKARWELKSTFLQSVINNYYRTRELANLPRDTRQGVCQEIAQLIGSHLGLKDCKSQPFTSFASLAERRPEQARENWRQAVRNLAARLTPLPTKKWRGQLEFSDPDCSIFRQGPYPRRMTVRWIASDSVMIWRRRKHFYASFPLFRGISATSALTRFQDRAEMFSWREHPEQWEALRPWRGVKLKGNEDLIMVELEHSPQLAAYLRDKGKRVCWSLLTERQVAGQTLFYLHLVTQDQVIPRERSNLLVVLPTLEANEQGKYFSCVRWVLVENEQISSSLKLEIDAIPTGPAKYGSSWQKARKQQAVELGRLMAQLANQLDANLVWGEVLTPDKRHGDNESNTRHSRWNWGEVITALKNKAADHSDSILTLWPISVPGWREYCTDTSDPRQAIRAVTQAALARERKAVKRAQVKEKVLS